MGCDRKRAEVQGLRPKVWKNGVAIKKISKAEKEQVCKKTLEAQYKIACV